jgi:predicted DNA-binding mobile mystery protein A|tara:strand:- start:860 stop:1366 length:507 start_codon:yes stop_codon:yes gene_type:complete
MAWRYDRKCKITGWQMSVTRAKQRQAQERINQAASLAKSLAKPIGGWIATFQQAIGMNAPALAERLGISRNNIYAAIQNEQAGTISVNQLEKIAEAMGGRLVYAIIPREGPVEEIVLAQARAKARRIIQRTRAHMALEEQTEGLRSEAEMIEELAADIIREGRRDFWQ